MMRFIPIAFLILAANSHAAEVKLSKNGICHDESSPYYSKTKNYKEYPDLNSCIRAGGRLPGAKNSVGTPSVHSQLPAQSSKYSRDQFGDGWSDMDGDCQDTRAEALVATSTVKPQTSGCKVVAGRWISPYTNNVILSAKQLDIDHVVPLHWAWLHGAASWSRQQREQFANDLTNLLPVESALNREKGSKGPNEWLPPSGQCQYVARFKRMVITYKLHMTEAEKTWFDGFLSRCK